MRIGVGQGSVSGLHEGHEDHTKGTTDDGKTQERRQLKKT
jgi:hypothetical protein